MRLASTTAMIHIYSAILKYRSTRGLLPTAGMMTHKIHAQMARDMRSAPLALEAILDRLLLQLATCHFTDLKNTKDPIGHYNDRWIKAAYQKADIIVACWGNHGNYLQRSNTIKLQFKNLHCIKLNKTLQPAHPLYQKRDLNPLPMFDAKNAST